MKRLARALDLTRSTRSRNGKEQALADMPLSIGRDEDDRDGTALSTPPRMTARQTLPGG